MVYDELAYPIRGYLKLLTKAQSLSAKRGGASIDLSYTVAKLVTWLREKNTDFKAWDALCQEAHNLHMAWLKWYGLDTGE